MKFDSNIILNSASNLNTGKKIIKDAKKSIKDFEIPNDFRYKNELKSYIDNMQSIAKDLDSITTWIQDKVEKFNNVKNNGINSAVMSSMNLIGANINSNIYTFHSFNFNKIINILI